MAVINHISLLCRLSYARNHEPCSGTCDGHGTGEPCELPCECWCHDDENAFIDLGLQHIFPEDYVANLDRELPYE